MPFLLKYSLITVIFRPKVFQSFSFYHHFSILYRGTEARPSPVLKKNRFRTYFFYHFLGYFYGGLILVYPLIFPSAEGGWDPYWPRILEGGFVIGFTFLSLFSPYVRRNSWHFIYAFLISVTIWLTLLVFTNNIRLDYAFFQLISVMMASAIIQNLRILWAFFGAIFILSLSLAWIPENPSFPPYAILVVEVVTMVGVSFLTQSQIMERRKWEQKEAAKEARSKELLQIENEILVEMSRHAGATEEELEQAIRKMSNRALETLQANEISVWLLFRKGTLVQCTHEVMHEGESGLKDKRIKAAPLSTFLQRIHEVRVASAWAPEENEARGEWERLYPGFIKSHCLWAPMRLSGNLKGFFIIQDAERTRDWSDAEVRFAGAMGDIGSMLMEGAKRRRVQDELKQRNFELDSFVYRASHDLKAPLNSMMGLLNLLNEGEVDEESKAYMKLMEKSVVKLNTFINKLNEFSRITRLAVKQEEVDFRAMVEEIFEGLQYMEGSDRLTKEFTQTGDSLVVGDKFHLEIILANLLSNAIKYQDFGKQAPFVKVQVTNQPKATLIEISDNGIGIPEKFKSKMFGLFFRASTQSFGSGLGLYIIKNTVTKLGGTIDFESEEGKGSTFRVRLPRERKEEEESDNLLKREV